MSREIADVTIGGKVVERIAIDGGVVYERGGNYDYEGLEYLESTGTQYCDTLIFAFPNICWEIDGEPTGNGHAFGVYPSSDSNIFFTWTNASENNVNYLMWRAGGNEHTIPQGRHVIRNIMGTEGYEVDDEYHFYSTAKDTNVNRVIHFALFATFATKEHTPNPYWQGQYWNGRCYRFRLWNGETNEQLRDMVAVRRLKDGTLGMYDLVERKFFPNLAKGEFIAGPKNGKKY